MGGERCGEEDEGKQYDGPNSLVPHSHLFSDVVPLRRHQDRSLLI
jgi:hypothetical protein